MTTCLDDPVSAPELARALGVSSRTVRKLAARGLVVKTARGAYDLVPSIQRYCEHLRSVAAGHGGEDAALDLATERARLAKEQADGHALKNAAARAELVPVPEVERRWADILRRVRSGLLAVPSRSRQRLPHLTAHDVTVIDQEVRSVLAGLEGQEAGR